MRGVLLVLMAITGITTGARAQLSYGNLFPDFTRVDINGRTHHLYDELDSGKTAIINIGATWSDLSWNYHNTNALEMMWVKHGPAGEPGVSPATTNDMVVYWIQGETQSGIAQLTLNATGSGAQTTTVNHTTYTKGNWVTGKHFYFICDSVLQGPFNTDWNIAYFPTVYMVCRDRLVRELSQPTEAEAYAEHLKGCPLTPPPAGKNAKAMDYMGAAYFLCNATMPVLFQNYGTDTITTATVSIKNGAGTTVATVPWTGTLPSYSVAAVSIPPFAGSTFGGYSYAVSVVGDALPADNSSADSIIKIYTAANAEITPAFEDFQGPLSYKRSIGTTDGNVDVTVWNSAMVDAYGNNAGARSIVFKNFYSFTGEQQKFVLGNFNTAATTNLILDFDVAYAQLATGVNDTLAVNISTNCGASWSTIWMQAGAVLATAPSLPDAPFYPTAATQWKHVRLNIPSYTSANTIVELMNTSDYGNNIWVDNIWLASPAVDVKEVVGTNTVLNIAPNPATDRTVLTLGMTESAMAQIQLFDAVGRETGIVNKQLNAGIQQVDIPTADLAAGIYYLKISVGRATEIRQLSVIR